MGQCWTLYIHWHTRYCPETRKNAYLDPYFLFGKDDYHWNWCYPDCLLVWNLVLHIFNDPYTYTKVIVWSQSLNSQVESLPPPNKKKIPPKQISIQATCNFCGMEEDYLIEIPSLELKLYCLDIKYLRTKTPSTYQYTDANIFRPYEKYGALF